MDEILFVGGRLSWWVLHLGVGVFMQCRVKVAIPPRRVLGDFRRGHPTLAQSLSKRITVQPRESGAEFRDVYGICGPGW